MSYIGNEPTSVAFLTDTFSGNGSTTAFTLSAAPATTSSILVAITGVLQDPSTYSVSGTTLTFSPAPPTGTGNISVRFLGIPASGVTTTAYRTVTEFTATSGQTSFSVPSYTVGFIDVYRNGVMLGSADYTATNGLTVVLAAGATAGDLVEVISFQVSSVLNAIAATAGSVGSSNIANGVTINFADGSASTPSITNDGDTNTGIFFPAADSIAFAEGGVEVARFDSSGNLGIGTSSPQRQLTINSAFPVIQFTNPTTGTTANDGLLIYQSGVNAGISNQEAGIIAFETSNTERMRITSGGGLAIGCTPTLSSSGLTRIYTNTTGDSAMIFNVEGSSSGVTLLSCFSNASSPSSPTGTIRFNLVTNGGIQNYSANNVNLSDIREKTDIELADNYLDKICSIPVKTFNYIDQNMDDDQGKTLGVIAQDVQEIAPELIKESNWGTKEEPKMRLSIYQTDLQYALMKCIQEQQAIITDLKARVEALENK